MQVHADYTWNGLLQHFRRRFAWVEKTRWFIDSEAALHAALMAAFKNESNADRCDAFVVRFRKDVPDWERRKIAKESREAIKAYMQANGCATINEAIDRMMTGRLRPEPAPSKLWFSCAAFHA